MRRTAPPKRRSELKRGPGPARRTRVKPVNRARRERRHAEAFGTKGAWIRSLPCLHCGRAPSEAAHVKSRGAGGTAEHLVPLCRGDHAAQHSLGILTFQARTGLDLTAEAVRLHAIWEARDLP